MQLNSTLSVTARPFQPQATLPLALVDGIHQDYQARDGLTRGSPTTGLTIGSPVRRVFINPHYTSDEEGVSNDTSTSEKLIHKRHGSRRS